MTHIARAVRRLPRPRDDAERGGERALEAVRGAAEQVLERRVTEERLEIG